MAIIRDDDEERRARIDQMLEQLKDQRAELERLKAESERKRQDSIALRSGSAKQSGIRRRRK